MARPNDPFWDRVEKLDDGRFNCKFCGYKFAAATSVTRIKWHLSGVQGRGVAICRQVPEDVQEAAFQAVHGGNKRHKGIASSSNFNDNAISTTPQEQNNEVDNLAGDAGTIQAPDTMWGQALERFLEEINNVMTDAGTTQAADRMGHPLGRSVEEFSRWLMEDDIENALGKSVEEFSRWLMEDDIENATGGVAQPGAGASSSGGLTGNTNEIPGSAVDGASYVLHPNLISCGDVESTFQAVDARTLKLQRSNIRELPDSICKLRHLRYLDVSHTKTFEIS